MKYKKSAVLTASIAAVVLSTQVSTQQSIGVMAPEKAQAFADAASRQLPYAPGEVVVRFRGVTRGNRDARATAALRSRTRDAATLTWINDAEAIYRDAGQGDPRAIAAQLADQPEVEFAEPNYIYQAHPRHALSRQASSERDALIAPRAAVPNDPSFNARQWNFTALDMTRAWDIEAGGSSSLIVAVVDTGITTQTGNFTFANWNGSAIVNQSFAFAVNPDLAASRLVSPYDFVNNSTTVFDMDGHGTHVSGTIAEDTNNAVSLSGMAYKVRIMPVKVCAGFWDVQFAMSKAGTRGQAPLNAGGCTNSDIAAGIRYAADNGAKVINLSLGGEQSSSTIRSAISYAVGKGAFIAAAGGNEYEDGNPTEWPAADAPSIDGLMSVAATNRSSKRAVYSNTGSYIEIAAPGGDSTDQSLGTGYIWQSTLNFRDQDPATGFYTPRFDRYADIGYQGTSMATPHVCGLAALMMSRGITSPSAVEALIKRTAKDLGDTGKDSSFGYGLIQPRTALLGVGATK